MTVNAISRAPFFHTDHMTLEKQRLCNTLTSSNGLKASRCLGGAETQRSSFDSPRPSKEIQYGRQFYTQSYTVSLVPTWPLAESS